MKFKKFEVHLKHKRLEKVFLKFKITLEWFFKFYCKFSVQIVN